ncbi:uncharacterized protein LOC6639742 [Drosophila willistoni]|uniref:uncharacterized protein LOC6639742 n=1 Tax=Drosophila willistoni TaxID=7260 RepID=UPI00017D6CE3|nr:uncharacterized protein LOC6639742 [Drosophila willistoni]
MNRGRKFKSLLAIRLGDILYDEHRRLIMLCRSCSGHFITFKTYEQHLDNCPGVKHILTPSDQLCYDEANRETRLIKGSQELQIYDIDAVKNISFSNISDDIDWQAELEDPRWYTDEEPPQTKQTTNKNGVKNYKRALEDKKEIQNIPKAKDKNLPDRAPPPKRSKLFTSATKPSKAKRNPDQVIVVPNLKEDLQRVNSSEKIAFSAIKKTTLQKGSISTISSAPTIIAKPAPKADAPTSPPTDGTQQILNKLFACGVQVKRGNTQLNSQPTAEAKNGVKNQQTLDIMRKLQSKGIKCTKVNK